MKRNPSHKWKLNIRSSAKSAFDKLPSASRRAIFRHLQQLLEAEAPYLLPFVDMLKEKRYVRLRKFRVGAYRVLFDVDVKPVDQGEYQYKGTLRIIEIEDRKDVYKD